MFESRHHSPLICLWIEARLGLGRRDVADGLEQTSVVEPVNPFQRGIFDRFQAPPRTAPVDDLGFEKADHRLSQSIVVTIADAAHRRLDAGLGKALGVFDR